MEFQSGQNCVTEINDMLCEKCTKTLCYIETSCAKCTNVMRKTHKCYAQNAETKCRNPQVKMQKQIVCSKKVSVIRYTVRGQALIRELT